LNSHPTRRRAALLGIQYLEDRTTPAPLTDLTFDGYVDGRVLVTVTDPAWAGPVQAALAASPVAAAVQPLGLGVFRVDLTPGTPVPAAAAALAQTPGVAGADPDYIVWASLTPNDPGYTGGSLWGLHNTGQGNGLPDADVDAPEAWDIARGTGATIVAVIDTGVDYTHPDLAANLWHNPGETAGNGLDDDGNGFVDDIFGADFLNNDGNPADDHGHGTHVAGTIGATGNNGLGVTGAAWATRIMALKFLGANGSGSTSGAVQAIDYALAKGARVLNNSWGGGGDSTALRAAVIRSRDAGAVFVAAAGNNGRDTDATPHYPSDYARDIENVVSVAATNRSDQLAGFSNFGAASVTLGAPGVDILSTLPGGGYGTYSGTSMASPQVSGALAVLWDQNPTWTYAQVVARLRAAADPIPALIGRSITGGRLNLFDMVAPTDAAFTDDFSSSSPRAAWTFVGGSWVQAGGVLRQTSAAPGDPFKAIVTDRTWSPAQEVTASVRVDSWVSGTWSRAGVGVRTNAAGEGYNLLFRDGNTVQFLNDHVAFGNAFPFTWETGVWYRFKLRAESDGTLRGKVWAVGQAEPANWMFTQAGWADRTGGGPALNGGSNGDGSSTVSFDDVIAANVVANPLFSDDFSGPSLGAGWTVDAGTWAQAGGALSQTGTQNADEKKAIVTGVAAGAAAEVEARVRVDSWTAGPYARAGVGLGTDAAGRGYNLVVRDGNQVQFLNDGVVWGNAFTFNWQIGTWYRFRLRQDADGTLRAKVWADGQAEPTNWMFTQTGWGYRVGWASLNGGSALTGQGNSTASFDDVRVWA